jgi:hypothetical protein
VARPRYWDTRRRKGRDNREPKLRPKPARQSSTLLERGRRKSAARQLADALLYRSYGSKRGARGNPCPLYVAACLAATISR